MFVSKNANNISTVKTLFDPSKYQLIPASSMSLGLFLAQKNFPDLILCEAALLEGDGFVLLETLKADEELASIPVVFVVNSEDKSGVDSSVDPSLLAGASYLLKLPLEASEPVATLKSKLEGLIQSRLLDKKDRPTYSPE